STQAQTPPRPPAQRFADKSEARIAIWKALVEHKVARFPFPLKGRIPNFDGADRAAARLLEHAVLRSAKCVKVNPDSPQRYVRKVSSIAESWSSHPRHDCRAGSTAWTRREFRRSTTGMRPV